MCSRRELLAGLGAAATMALLSACASDGGTAPEGTDAVTVTGGVITLRLDRVNALGTPDSAFVIGVQNVIVLRLAGDDYRAFTNVCTHSGCGIFTFDARRMRCQCHGSEFDVTGRNVAGPAPSPLTRYAATLDAGATTLRIDRRVTI